MKKILSAIILTLALACCAALAESDYTYFPESEAYVGTWTDGNYTLDIVHAAEDENLFCCMVSRNLDENSSELWLYDGCAYDDVSQGLSCEMIGVKSILTFNDEGKKTGTVVEFNDGAAAFKLDGEGNMVWTDFKGTPGSNEITLERAEAEKTAPTPEAFAEEYFKVIGGIEQGTAGSSLKMAQATAAAARFAISNELWDPDVELLRKNMLEGWESLSAEEQSAFDANFIGVAQLIDSCLEDWESNQGIFDDAGAAEDMEALVFDPLNRLAWENLCAHTLTMGNSEE